MPKFSLILSLLTIVYFPVHAQSIIKGKAVDNATGSRIGFVAVSLLSKADSSLVKGQIADSSGIFELSGILPGKYILQLSSFGYNSLYKEVGQEKNDGNLVDLGDFLMLQSSKQLNEVIVMGEKPAIQRLADKLVLNVSGNRLFNSAASALDILKKAPGLDVNGDGTIQMLGRITPSIFIDGKSVVMSAEELQNYLASLSPEMIASIEIITNPSARYDGVHKGIIDIKLKRDLTLGWKGNLSTNTQYNDYTYLDNNLLLTYKTKQLTYTARLGYTAGDKIYRYSALQHLANTDIMATNTKVRTGNSNLNFQFGADYNFKKGQQIAIMLRAYHLNRDINSFNTLHTTDSTAQKQVFSTNSINDAGPKQYNYAANLNYTAHLGKSELEVLSAFVKINNRQNEDIQNKNTVTEHLLDYWKTNLKNDILIRSAQADLSQNRENRKWGAGVRFAFTTTKNDLRYDTLNTAALFALDSSRTNNFQYDEYITSAYVSYEGTQNKLTYALSLRTEYTHSIANAFTQQQIIKRNYLTWLPGLSFSFRMNTVKQLNLSYSRRVTRPDFDQLNPFRFYISPLNYRVGNPYLQPSTTDMVSISYTLRAFNGSLFIGRESDPMSRYPEYDRATNILQYLGRNLPYNDFAGIEISAPLSVNTWWKMNHNIRGVYKKEQTPYHGITYAIPIFEYTISGSQVFTLPKEITFDISYFYRSLGGNGLYISKPMSSIDLGVQKSWIKGKLSSKINYYDILDTYKVNFIFREKSIINNEMVHWFGNRRVAVTLSYNFGTSTHKGRQSSKDEEERRAGM
jgi:hypothetical protein